MRVPFTALFEIRSDATIRTKVPVEVGGFRLNSGATFGRGALIGGLELGMLTHRDLIIQPHADCMEITAVQSRNGHLLSPSGPRRLAPAPT